MNNITRVTVYCASSSKVDEKYFAMTRQVANLLADNNIEVVYGGGAVGLMGQLADTMIEQGGRVTGIMPDFMHQVEWQHNGISELIIVKDMHERKARFMEHTDALIALPGGCGTLEELLEAITLKRLGVFVKPIIIINYDGFYNPLIQMLDRCIEQNFMRMEHQNMWVVIQSPDSLIDAIQNAPDWDESAIKIAGV